MVTTGRALEFGVLLHTADLTGDHVAHPDLAPLWEQTTLVEELGYDHVWVGDSSRIEIAWPRADCLTIMTAMAMKTTRLRIGTVPLSVPLRNPVLLAHALATADVISNGRLIIGAAIGKGGDEGLREFQASGVPNNERGARLTESLDLMRRLWTEESVNFEGKYYSIPPDMGIRPRPIQRPIPTFVAAGVEPALARAGRFGDGWFTMARDPQQFSDLRRKVDAYAREAGREGQADRSAIYATFHLDKDGERARRNADGHLDAYFGAHHRSGAAAGYFGSPEEVAERLQEMVDRGLTTVVARVIGSDFEQQSKLLLDDMLPRLTARPLGTRVAPA